MRHRDEDAIIRYAFGELEGAEADRIQKLIEADPSAKAVFHQCADLRSGLGRMRAPEHQLSNERLMQAILTDDLSRKRRSWWFGLPERTLSVLSVPASVLTLAFAAWLAWPMIQRSSVGGDSSPQVAREEAASPAEPMARSLSATAPSESALSNPALSILRAEPAPAVTRTLRSRTPRAQAYRSVTASRSGSAVAAGREEPAVMLAPPETAMPDLSASVIEAAAPSSLNEAEDLPVVLLGGDSDENTGAASATEVTSHRDVVVGG